MSRWIPVQHGAWAMLSVPVVVGTVYRAQTDDVMPAAPLILCWFLGYLGFVAVSNWLKSRPARRASFVAPAVTYCGSSLGFGLIAVALAGWQLLLWAACYAPILAVTLLLTATNRERSTLSGALTVAAAALMTITSRFYDPTVIDWHDPTISLALLVFAYFFGTVFYVKTLIRERGHASWRVLSAGWHAAVLLATSCAAAFRVLSWLWVAFFFVTLIRAVLVPRYAGQGRDFIRKVGFGEVGLSFVFLAIALLA